VKSALTKIWGDANMADYYVNPARVALAKPSAKKRKDDSSSGTVTVTSNTNKHLQKARAAQDNPRRSGGGGLFAYMIWDSLREDSGDKLNKTFDLNAELKVCNFNI
jgi:hypothetical protein